MATPAEHATEATNLLTAQGARTPSRFDTAGTVAAQLTTIRRAQVHAVLSKAAGTGADYAAAEALVDGTTDTDLALALAHAQLAP